MENTVSTFRIRYTVRIMTVLPVIMLSACNSAQKIVPEPTKITVSEAMEEIALGFINMKKRLGEANQKIGMFPCKATTTFNVTAGATDNNKLVLNAAVSPAPAWEKLLITGGLNANADMSSTVTASRGNVIVIELYNPACIPNNTLGYDKPDKISTAMGAIGSDVMYRYDLPEDSPLRNLK